MKIALIRPPAVESFRFATTSITAPLGMAYIAAAVRDAGHAVEVVDAVSLGAAVRTGYYKGYLVGLGIGDIVLRVPGDAEVIGISVVFTHEWPIVVALIDRLKDRFPAAVIVVGGEHVTAMPEFCLATSKADFAVLGEGEETIVALLDIIRGKGDPAAVAGIGWRHPDGGIAVNARRARRERLDDISPPAWDLIDLPTYHRNRFVGGMYSDRLTVPLLATRGCPYQCTYCSAPNMWLPDWNSRDPRKVVDEIEGYVRTYGAGNFPFQDLTAIINKDWIKQFCEEIVARGLDITWQMPTGTRSEAIDLEVAKLLKKSGMISMAYAPESGSETTRRLVKKRMKTERLYQSIEMAAAADLNVATFLVIGFPHDRPEHLRDNLGFIDTIASKGVTDLSVGFYMALPGTELFESLYDAQRIRLDRNYFRHILDSLSLVPGQNYCEHMSRYELVKWKLGLLLRFYGARKKQHGTAGLAASIRRAITGFGSGGHSSKLETAFRNGLSSAWESVKVRFRPRWIPQAEEDAMFAGWDAVYREIRRQKRAQGIGAPAPRDTTLLSQANVIPKLRAEHGTPRRVSLETQAAGAA